MKNNRIKNVIRLLAASLCLAPLASRAQELLLHYDFNTPSADKKILDVSLQGREGKIAGSTAGWGVSGSGVSGKAGDHAFQNTALPTMGANSGGYAAYVNGTPPLDGLSSFTISMWFKTDTGQSLGNSARLFQTSSGLMLAATAAGQVNMYRDSTDLTKVTTSHATLASENEWVFVAITYTYENTLGTMSIYTGSSAKEGGVSLVGFRTTDHLSGLVSLSGIYFGSSSNGSRSFDGCFDDIRIYGVTSGRDGALLGDALNEIRLQGISQIPESSNMTACIGVVLLLLFGAKVCHRHLRYRSHG